MGNINYLLKAVPNKGRIVYEYNPLLNFRFEKDKYKIDQEGNIIKDSNGRPVIEIAKGAPTNMITGGKSSYSGLNFDLTHPVDITCQQSYDGSINLIINDNKNIPRLINTRFSPLQNNTYEIVDREGNNDTNLYDEDQFDTDTSLYKRVNKLPKVKLLDISNSGNLKVGNYVFYFTYADADDNETDFIAESGLVSCFIGMNKMPSSINGGYKDQNSQKAVTLQLTNIDRQYDYIRVYYSRASSDVDENIYKSAHKIVQKYPIVSNKATIYITGNEDADDIPLTDLNIKYFLADSVKTQAECQNRLFFGNMSSPTPNHKELKDLSLRILPYYHAYNASEVIGTLSSEYKDNSNISTKYKYYNALNIYNSVGYWPEEIYRFGVVYIMKDGSLSPVYNTMGMYILNNSPINEPALYEDDKNGISVRKYLKIDEEDYTVNNDIKLNAKGVCRFNNTWFNGNNEQLISINFSISEALRKELAKYATGFFFVRQKRIPTILAQGWTLAMEEEASVPLIPLPDKQHSGKVRHSVERFLTDKRLITHDYAQRLYPQEYTTKKVKISELSNFTKVSGLVGIATASPIALFACALGCLFGRSSSKVDITVVNTEICQVSSSKYAIICPEYELNQAYFNQLFTGSTFPLKVIGHSTNNCIQSIKSNNRLYGINTIIPTDKGTYIDSQIAAIPDAAPVVIIEGQKFRAYLGEAEDATKFRYIGFEQRETEAHNLVRGLFGTYLGAVGKMDSGQLVNIYIPDYNEGKILTYFKERYEDNSEYFAISDRFESNNIEENLEKENNFYKFECFRGDSFLCNFTHRLNRNFQDSSAPTNDVIIEPDTWTENYDIDDQEKTHKINRGDINAVKLGSWITVPVRATRNISLRSTDLSYPTEEGMFGHPRGFYPLQNASPDGSYKMPESGVLNGGFGTTLGERWNYTLPAAPYFKNIYQTRIAYSDIAIGDAFKNGYRVFNSTNFRDYPRTYGGIMKMLDWQGNLLVVFEHGIALIPVNERVVAGEGDGGNVFINTNNILPENPKMISDAFGSQWPDSVIKTSQYVYGVDTVAKKIWRTDGNAFTCISDFKVQKFLNDNIKLGEFEMTPIIGVRNVKTHYNAFKQDIMFTYYDHTKGLHEIAWNLCYNEIQDKFITFYSWIPSFSENINNIFFTFDRDTSKKFAKLATSNTGKGEADGITLSEVDISKWKSGDEGIYTELKLSNRYLPDSQNLDITYNFALAKDKLNYHKLFEVKNDLLIFKGSLSQLPDTFYLNLTSRPQISAKKDNSLPQHELFAKGWNDQSVQLGLYDSVIAITKDSTLGGVTTAFWRHGQAGLFDRAEKIKPTTWYGKTHPFEFEVIVADKPTTHKIFNNLKILSNKAEPESFHYEVVGESYDFNWDKKNMYYRQEATKAMYQALGSDIVYDWEYLEEIQKSKDLSQYTEHVPAIVNKDESIIAYKKSTLFPLTYFRQDSLETIDHNYKCAPDCCVQQYTENGNTKYRFILAPEENSVYEAWKTYKQNGPGALNRDYEHLAGAEITYDKTLNEFKVWNHAKAVNIKDPKYGRLRGNMNYLEDMWDIQINPIIFVEKNEKAWIHNVPPIAIVGPLPNDIITPQITDEYTDANGIIHPGTFTNTELAGLYDTHCIDTTTWGSRKETKPRDKYLRVRVRYSGKELAVINSLITQFTISYA